MILSPLPVQKFFDNNGRPLAGGLLFTYAAGTTTKIDTYSDESGGSLNTNPIVLDFRGECNVWLDPTLTYKFVLAPRTDTDPPADPIWTVDDIAAGLTVSELTQQFLGRIIYPRSQAEIDAGVTPIEDIQPYGVFQRYGAAGNDATNDYAAINSALLQAAESGGAVAKGLPGLTYYIAANTLTVPNGVTLDISGCGIRTTDECAVSFGNGSILMGYDATIETSGASGAALKKTDTATPSSFYIYGWPSLTPTTMGTAGGIGLDFTAAYKGVFEVAIEGYETNITGGSAATTPQTYYNEFRSPRMRCTSGTTGIKLRNGCNGTILINPQINGANVATYALHVDAASGTMVVGGYLEGFNAAAATRGVLLNDTDNFTMIGTTLEQGTDATANFAIGVTGTSTQCNFFGLGFAGAWGDSSRIMSWAGSGVYSFIGGAPTNQVCLIGLATFAGSYLAGETHVGNFYSAAISATVSTAAAIAHTIANSGDGLGLEVSNNSATEIAARAVLLLNRKGGQGCVMAMQNNGTTVAGLFFYSGSPEAALAAPVGSVCMDITNGVQYNKNTGTGNTGWKLVTQAA